MKYFDAFETNKWEEFSCLHENRQKIKESHFKNLKKAICRDEEDCYLISPIIVMPYDGNGNITNIEYELNGDNIINTRVGSELVKDDSKVKYSVIDGQHRLMACMELGINALVFVNDKIKRDDVKVANNSATRWGTWDYITFNAAANPEADENKLITKIKGTLKEGARPTPYNAKNHNKDGWESKGFGLTDIANAFMKSNGGWGINAAVKGGSFEIDIDYGDYLLTACKSFESKLPDKKFKEQKFIRTLKSLSDKHPEVFDYNTLLDALPDDKTEIASWFKDRDYLLNKLTKVYYDSFNDRSEHRAATSVMKELIKQRDNFTCKYCNLDMKDDIYQIEIDHREPYALGGKTTISNLQVLCKECNRKKGATIEAELEEKGIKAKSYGQGTD